MTELAFHRDLAFVYLGVAAVVFVAAGYLINCQADRTLANLRKPGERCSC